MEPEKKEELTESHSNEESREDAIETVLDLITSHPSLTQSADKVGEAPPEDGQVDSNHG